MAKLNSRETIDPVGSDPSRGTTKQNQQLDVGGDMPYEAGNDLMDHLDCEVSSLGGSTGTITSFDVKEAGTNYDDRKQSLKYGACIEAPRIT